MKITRESRNAAKKLFALCQKPDGGVDEAKLRQVLAWMEKEKPRNAVGTLTRLHKLVSLALAEATAVIETPVELDKASAGELEKKLKAVFGESTEVEYETNPDLIGGVLVRRGSTVWDGSIQGRLNQLKKQFS
ncbi:MAG: F0F1 ATP synthase subunit delta [Verrucomicrobiota bacterium]